MEKIFMDLKLCPLFKDIPEEDIDSMLDCLNAQKLTCQKNEAIFNAGDPPEYFGIVLSGSVHVLQEDYWGNRTILTSVQPGGLFGEAFSCAEVSTLPVSVIAQSYCEILLIDSRRILNSCSSSCTFHTRLIGNLMKILAGKNIFLTRKMEHISKKTTKEKVLSYLSECAVSAGTNSFTIPFNRQELADYLSVERSALSATLGKMRDEGLITFEKSRFTL